MTPSDRLRRREMSQGSEAPEQRNDERWGRGRRFRAAAGYAEVIWRT